MTFLEFGMELLILSLAVLGVAIVGQLSDAVRSRLRSYKLI